MIEIICREDLQKEGQGETKEMRKLPKNIRQVGSPRGRHKIYIEDYVYTYIRNMARKKESCAAIFLGSAQVDKDIRYTFISGAVECGAAVFQWDSIQLDDSFWDYVYKEKKKYFPELEIVGWFQGKVGQPMELSSAVESAHRKYFAGRDKLLMLMDVLEGEEVFFVHEQGYLQKREGYYIYYEKNLPMQEYMVCKHEEEQQLEGGTGWGKPESASGIEPEDSRTMPRTGEFAGLYRELQQLDSPAEAPSPYEETLFSGKPKEKPLPRPLDGIGEKSPQLPRSGNSESAEKKEQDALKDIFEKLREDLVHDQAKVLREKTASRKLQTEGIGKNAEKIFAKNNEKEPKTSAEQALESYRNTALERHGRQIARQNRNFLYTASSFFLVILCVIGITTINNYRKMQEVEETLHILKSTGESQQSAQDSAKAQGDSADGSGNQEGGQGSAEAQGDSQNNAEGQDGLVVESIASQVTPLEDAKDQANSQDMPDGNSNQLEGSNDTGEPSSSGQERVRYYTVQPGDTLDSICKSIYNSLDIREELCQLNEITDGNKIFVGQRLRLP